MIAMPERFELLDHAEQVLDVVLRERAGRLVEDDHLGLDGQRPGDLDHLLIGHRQLPHRHVERQVGAAEQVQALGARAAAAPRGAPGRSGSAPGRA